MSRVRIAHEVSMAVADYAGNFDACSHDLIGARKVLDDELKKLFGDYDESYKVKSVRFEEFDSSDPSNACAYFYCEVLINAQDLFNLAADRVLNG